MAKEQLPFHHLECIHIISVARSAFKDSLSLCPLGLMYSCTNVPRSKTPITGQAFRTYAPIMAFQGSTLFFTFCSIVASSDFLNVASKVPLVTSIEHTQQP
ncbi:Uncharacterized protein Fot_37333 [Forsythia ovata]|uniref:Uncharacterized protein n=1 Tax=Forsythia ovata TaxID=205694 RepID=A0ABD1RZE8_9LAMI